MNLRFWAEKYLTSFLSWCVLWWYINNSRKSSVQFHAVVYKLYYCFQVWNHCLRTIALKLFFLWHVKLENKLLISQKSLEIGKESLHTKVLLKWRSKIAVYVVTISLSRMQGKNKAAQIHFLIKTFNCFEGKNGLILHKHAICCLRNSHGDVSWKHSICTSWNCPPEPGRNIDSYHPWSIAAKLKFPSAMFDHCLVIPLLHSSLIWGYCA